MATYTKRESTGNGLVRESILAQVRVMSGIERHSRNAWRW
jgi:hypothetical protein